MSRSAVVQAPAIFVTALALLLGTSACTSTTVVDPTPSADPTTPASSTSLCDDAPDYATVVAITGISTLDETPSVSEADSCAYTDPADATATVVFSVIDGDQRELYESVAGYTESATLPGVLEGPSQVVSYNLAADTTFVLSVATGATDATTQSADLAAAIELAGAWGTI